MRCLFALALALATGAAVAGATDAEPDALRVSRYTTVAATPSEAERDPLRAVIRVTFPRPEVRTVADAIAYILPRTGYRFSPEALADAEFAELLRQPLPESQRVLGPYTAISVLQTLAGDGYQLGPDAATRRIRLIGRASGESVTADSLAQRSEATVPPVAVKALPAQSKEAQ